MRHSSNERGRDRREAREADIRRHTAGRPLSRSQTVRHSGLERWVRCVPVEIKKDRHPDLWSAIRTQLVSRYTRDPGAEGYGIYLVFWFGEGKCPSPESGTVPKHPAELEKRPRATLSSDEANLISICVIDVSRTE